MHTREMMRREPQSLECDMSEVDGWLLEESVYIYIYIICQYLYKDKMGYFGFRCKLCGPSKQGMTLNDAKLHEHRIACLVCS